MDRRAAGGGGGFEANGLPKKSAGPDFEAADSGLAANGLGKLGADEAALGFPGAFGFGLLVFLVEPPAFLPMPANGLKAKGSFGAPPFAAIAAGAARHCRRTTGERIAGAVVGQNAEAPARAVRSKHDAAIGVVIVVMTLSLMLFPG